MELESIVVDLTEYHKLQQRSKAKWIEDGYLWDDAAGVPTHQAVVNRLLALKGMSRPRDTDIHHIDHNKQNNAPTNLILVASIAHSLIHMATARWSGKESIGNLCVPEGLLMFLDRARVAYLYAGSLVSAGGSNNHNHTHNHTKGDT